VSPETILFEAVEAALAGRSRGPLVVGLCGAQGSGKSTLAARLAAQFERTAILSLDDLYRTRAERQVLARQVHPLFATRGVPGTHDVALGLATLATLDRGEGVPLPRFDKATDDRADPATWPHAAAGCRLLLFEGWCVGAVPQEEAALAEPVNDLEAEEDRQGIWRRYANAALAGDYQRLFARIDLQVLLAAPNFETVLDWRLEQERALRASGADGSGVMDDPAVARFVRHYERLTRHILGEMPNRVDLVLQLGRDRSCVGVTRRAGGAAAHRA